MDPASEALPDDVAALKAALVAERARRLEVAAELAVARAKASEDMALIAAQKLQIAKLERQVYGQRSERSARLIDQLALEFEELAAESRRRRAGGGTGGREDDRSPSICRASASCSTRRRPANAAAAPGCASSARTSRVRSR